MKLEIYKGFKLYLSSLTGRRCKYWFFNLLKNKNIILATNGDTVEKNNIILEFCSPDLAIHRIEFNKDLVYTLKRELRIPNDKVVRLDTRKFCSLMNKAKIDTDISCVLEGRDLCLYIDGIRNTVGDIFNNYNAAIVLTKLHDDLLKIEETNNNNEFNEIELKDFKVNNPYVALELNIKNNAYTQVLIDGLDCVSLKEFIKKLKIDFEFKLLYWCTSNKTIEFISYFKSQNLFVKTFRPNFRLFMLRQ